MGKQRKKEPWPTKAVMSQIYEKKMWGGEASTDFYSGMGSHALGIVNPYVEEVLEFLNSLDKKLILCDLGCGDFNVGRQLVDSTQKYIAVDIVPALIERNKGLFKMDNLEFHCLDICNDVLPKGDCAIVRQVMQHLNNVEINKLLEKLVQYKYLILTEHLPLKEYTANIDIVTGQGIRLKKNSGVNILMPPFSMQTKVLRDLSVVKYNDSSAIFTRIYQNF
ncbi:class I SAM-dependent methyltransferase [uncultured Maribacter sp.]|uniref:class I SAM-dependent methyltransferase n=1 Tax=uncultured Maribacter sp. TaxID=431308 RepID=UPI002602A234|nr:class I SAM-dependent methyltransferase [uncultured Maribacter sp.]